jgi:hypothetical protein
MKKILLLLVAIPLILFAENNNSNTTTANPEKTPRWQEFLRSSTASIIPGAAIGACSGFGCYEVENKVIGNQGEWTASRVITWIGFSFARSAIVSSVSQTMSKYDIQHSPGLMQSSAWIIDWLVFLNKLH